MKKHRTWNVINAYKMKRDKRLEKDFLPEVDEIIEKPSSPLGHYSIWIIFILMAVMLLWSYLGKMDEVSTSRGKVSTADGLHKIQAVDGGVINKIYIKEGDTVKKGQKIINLNSELEEAGLKACNEQIALLELKNKVLNDALEGDDLEKYRLKSYNSDELEVINYVTALKNEYEVGKEQYDIEIEKVKNQLETEKETLKKNKIELDNLIMKEESLKEQVKGGSIEQLALDKIIEDIKNKEKKEHDAKDLYKNGVISKSEWEDISDELSKLRIDKSIQELKVSQESNQQSEELNEYANNIEVAQIQYDLQAKNIEDKKFELSELEKKVEINKENYKKELLNEILVAKNELPNMLLDKETKEYNYKNKVLVSPVDGTVISVLVNTIGGVVTPAQEIAVILPIKSELIIEADLPNSDIGLVKVGQEASVKVDSYNFQDYGKLYGKVTYISPDVFKDELKGYIYKIKISVDMSDLNNKNSKIDISAGMEGTVEIKLGERRIIDFFIEPLFEHFDSSLKVK